MSGRIFQNVVLQLKETTDRTIGVIDAEGTVIACSELTGIGKKWSKYIDAITAAEGECIALEGKPLRHCPAGGHVLIMPYLPAVMTTPAVSSAPWRRWH